MKEKKREPAVYLKENLGNLLPKEAFGALCTLPLPFFFPARADTNGNLYTYAGAAPYITVTTDLEGNTTITEGEQARSARDPFYAISEIIKESNYIDTPRPFPFSGGAAGYFAYDLKNIVDGPNRGTASTRERKRGLGLPLCMVGIYHTVYVYDHKKKEAWVVTGKSRPGATSPKKNRSVVAALRSAALTENKEAEATPPCPAKPAHIKTNRSGRAKNRITSNTTRAGHIKAIERALEYINAGDIYQINLSHMLTLALPPYETPFALFCRLTGASPAPFAAYFDAGDFQVLSNSPERLLAVTQDIATVEPIKGTRPRGASDKEDSDFIDELKASTKERAEHVMIVDLERNDLGRVAVAGGVTVTEFERIVTLPGLHHMVSTVKARLQPGVDSLGALRAAYPGGSITGAPKVRAMEIIDELEGAPRSIYTGGIGYIDFSGDLDIAMAIRTAVCRGNSLYINVGGGIVADSDPAAEYEETILKAKDFIELTTTDTD